VSERGRILMVSNFFDSHRGGLEIVAGRLARELAGRGFTVTWLATDAAAPPEPTPGLTCVSMRAWNGTERRLGLPWPLLSPGAMARLWRETAAADAVLLHDSLYLTSIVTALAARARRRPLVVVQHIGAIRYNNPLLRALMALANRAVGAPLLARAHQVVFISQVVREHFARTRLGAAPELIFNGVDTEVFRPGDAAERAAARRRFGLPAERMVALFVGRFVEKKGLAVLREAAAIRPDVVFALAGWGPEDPDAWGLANVRVFRGLAGAELAELYRAGDALVLPSRGEGFPLVVQEALAAGLPVVCGAESAAADPQAAILLHPIEVEGDPEAAALRVMGALEAALAAGCEGAATRHEFARRRYGWPQAADRYAEILTRLVGDGGRSAGPARNTPWRDGDAPPPTRECVGPSLFAYFRACLAG